jgi:hypothetical protein
MPKQTAKKKLTREDYEQKIEELESQITEQENQSNEDQILRDTISYRRELLTVLNRIAEAVENSSRVGGEPDEKYLPETPDPEPQPEPVPDDEEDF